jgi:hypothetical protein
MKRVYLWAFEAGNSDDGDCRWRPGPHVSKPCPALPQWHDRPAVRFRTFALLKALDAEVLGLKPDVEGVCPRWGKSPFGHLFESLTCGYIVFEIGHPDLNPHTA